MATGYVELYINQGTTFNDIIYLTDDTTNTAMNIAGYSVESQVRRSYYSENASANIVCAITDAQNGEITMFMSKANTANIKAGRYVFDVMLTDTENATSKILDGIITVVPRVTK